LGEIVAATHESGRYVGDILYGRRQKFLNLEIIEKGPANFMDTPW